MTAIMKRTFWNAPLLARLLLCVTLVGSAFHGLPSTHRAIAQAQLTAEFALPDGSLPVFCIIAPDGQTAGLHDCPDCLLCQGAANVANHGDDGLRAAIPEASAISVERSAVLVRRHRFSQSRPRAPPLSQV